MTDLVIINGQGNRILWDSDGDGKAPAPDQYQNFNQFVSQFREQKVVAPGTHRTGSHQGTVYQTGQLPPENKTIYVPLGEGQSFWTLAEDLGMDPDANPEKWMQLVADNPQYTNPDQIPDGAVIAVNVDLLPPDVRAKLAPPPQQAADNYASSLPNGYIPSASIPDRAAQQLSTDMSLMTPEQRVETLEKILSNPQITAENKQKAVQAYLGTMPPEQHEDATIGLLKNPNISNDDKKLAVTVYLNSLPEGADKGLVLKGLNYGEYQGSTFSHPAQTVLEAVAKEQRLTVDFSK
jgi:hypothetical protein